MGHALGATEVTANTGDAKTALFNGFPFERVR
jgi:hypothetical protein